MADLSLGNLKIKQRVQFIQENTGTVISLDCSVSETHSRESPPTEFEVENGSTVSDHVIVKPFGLEIQGIISDSPISLTGSLLSTVATVAAPPVGVIGAAAGLALMKALTDSDSPSVAAFKQIKLLQERKQPFNVFTTLNLYTNMWIKSISIPRDAQNGNALVFTVSLVELLLVQPVTVNLAKLKNPDVSSSQYNNGRQELQQSGTLQKFKQGQQAFRNLGVS